MCCADSLSVLSAVGCSLASLIYSLLLFFFPLADLLSSSSSSPCILSLSLLWGSCMEDVYFMCGSGGFYH